MRTTKKVSKKETSEEKVNIDDQLQNTKGISDNPNINVLKETKEEPIKSFALEEDRKKAIDELSKLTHREPRPVKETAKELDPYGEEDWGGMSNPVEELVTFPLLENGDGKKFVFNNEYWDNKAKEKKTNSENNWRPEDTVFVREAMGKFSDYINDQYKSMVEKTTKYENIKEEDDNDPNIHLKITPVEERERVLFKDKLLLSGQKRRPIYVTMGDYDFFYEYIDKDDSPIFSFNRKSFDFFFDKNLEKLKKYIQDSACSFGLGVNLGLKRLNEKPIKFNNFLVEIVEKKKKEKPSEPKVELKINKKVCKVKFLNNKPIFILTEDPGNIFKQYNNEVLSVKIIGDGITL